MAKAAIENQAVFIEPEFASGKSKRKRFEFRKNDDFSLEGFNDNVTLDDLPRDIGVAFINSSSSPKDYATLSLRGSDTSALYATNTNEHLDFVLSGDAFIGYDEIGTFKRNFLAKLYRDVLGYKSGRVHPGTTIDTYSGGGTNLNELLPDKRKQKVFKYYFGRERGNVFVSGGIAALGVIISSNIQGAVKYFNIPHPTKEDKRLVHACLEGPENGVYFRGRLKGEGKIEFPEYWVGLVDSESVSVQLTQIGSSQDLIVENIDWPNSITVRSGNGSEIDCYYTINGTRIDVPPLKVEQEIGIAE